MSEELTYTFTLWLLSYYQSKPTLQWLAEHESYCEPDDGCMAVPTEFGIDENGQPVHGFQVAFRDPETLGASAITIEQIEDRDQILATLKGEPFEWSLGMIQSFEQLHGQLLVITLLDGTKVYYARSLNMESGEIRVGKKEKPNGNLHGM